MAAKLFFLLCAQAVFVQVVLSQCTSRASVIDSGFGAGIYGLGSPYGYETPIVNPRFVEPINTAPCALAGSWDLPALEYSPTSGGPLPVASSSSIPPTGISVVSDNIIEGPLEVTGELPFVGTVVLDGVMPSLGSGLINHSCGNGVNAMISEINTFAPGYAGAYSPSAYSPSAYSPSLAVPSIPSLGYRSEWVGRGSGCGW